MCVCVCVCVCVREREREFVYECSCVPSCEPLKELTDFHENRLLNPCHWRTRERTAYCNYLQTVTIAGRSGDTEACGSLQTLHCVFWIEIRLRDLGKITTLVQVIFLQTVKHKAGALQKKSLTACFKMTNEPLALGAKSLTQKFSYTETYSRPQHWCRSLFIIVLPDSPRYTLDPTTGLTVPGDVETSNLTPLFQQGSQAYRQL